METTKLHINEWTLRVSIPDTPGPHQVMLLLHGWTGDENVMWVFARKLLPTYLVVAPRAPYPTSRGGYGWQPTLADSWPTVEDLRPAVDSLLTLLEALATDVRTASGNFHTVDVMGFSQGAAVAATWALTHPQRVRALALLAGFLPDGADDLTLSQPLAGKFAFVAHGTRDAMVPVTRAHQSVALLQQAGARVTYCEDETGHKLSASCARALWEFWEAMGRR